MPTHLLQTSILINQYPIVIPKAVVYNNESLSIKKSVVVPFSAMNNNLFFIGGAIFGVLVFIYKYRK